ncbi:MAG: hypothetical protein OXG33_11275 [Chloroflexi bacterium]|nr:hypothetical protein [Chloroflexota bacterium]
MAADANDPRWSEWPFVDLETLPEDQQERLQAARDAWDRLHATGDRTGLVELGILPTESTTASDA